MPCLPSRPPCLPAVAAGSCMLQNGFRCPYPASRYGKCPYAVHPAVRHAMFWMNRRHPCHVPLAAKFACASDAFHDTCQYHKKARPVSKKIRRAVKKPCRFIIFLALNFSKIANFAHKIYLICLLQTFCDITKTATPRQHKLLLLDSSRLIYE